MATLFDYLAWRGDIGFDAVAPCEVDSLIFSQIVYLDFEGIVPSEKDGEGVRFVSAMKKYLAKLREEKTKLGALFSHDIVLLATMAARSRRFGTLFLSGFVNKINEEDQSQFCAMTFKLSDKERYIAFRGTDDTLVGWKESFNMSFMLPIPSQLEALEYLRDSLESSSDSFYLGGHSKGGNLAVFAAVEAPEEHISRIAAAYNLDGPGFTREFLEKENYIARRQLIKTFIPQSSVVGMLLEHEESYIVVKSSKSGLLQHDGISWEVMGSEFIHLETITEESRKIDETLKAWLETMSSEERKAFFDTVYDTLSSSNAKTLTELNADKIKLLQAWSLLDSDKKAVIKNCVLQLLRLSRAKDEMRESNIERRSVRLPSTAYRSKKYNITIKKTTKN